MSKGRVWFSADLHLGSERTLTLSKRPFESVDEMNETIISNWNSVVREDDVCYIVGDIGDLEIARKLNGKLVLITGNYEEDDIQANYYGNKYHYIDTLKENGFHKVFHEWYRFFDKNYENRMYLTHKPSDCKSHEFNLFGHVHKLSMIKSFGLNVGTDCHNFFPIDMDTVLFYKKAIEEFYDDEVFMSKL